MADRGQLHVAYRAVLLAAGLLLFGLVFHELVTLVLAVLLTVIIAIPLAAGAAQLERFGIPRVVGVLATLVAGLAIVGGMLALVIPTFVDETDLFIDRVPTIVDDLRSQVVDVTGATRSEVGEEAQEFLRGYAEDPMRLIGPIASVGLTVVGGLGALILMLVTASYIAIRPEPLIEGLVRLVPPASRSRAEHVLMRLRTAWVGWLQGVAADMLVTGVLLYLGLRLIDLDFALVFAVLAALLVVIPYFGAITAGVLPVLFALTDSPGKAALVLAIYLLVQQIEGNLVIPLIMARTVRLHPAVIAIGVVVVGQLFGLLGLFVSVPIVSAVMILVEEMWVRPMEAAAAQEETAAGVG